MRQRTLSAYLVRSSTHAFLCDLFTMCPFQLLSHLPRVRYNVLPLSTQVHHDRDKGGLRA